MSTRRVPAARISTLKQKVKPFALHVSLFAFVFIYASLGGFIIQRLENDAITEQKVVKHRRHRTCLEEILNGMVAINDISSIDRNATIRVVSDCFHVDEDERSQWSMVTGTLYGFGIITTLGYNRIEPKTLKSRLFCVVYGIIGIPITMIIIVNIGQHLNQFAGDTRKMLEAHLEQKQRDLKAGPVSKDDIPDTTTELMAVALLIMFLIYCCIGAVMLPLLNGEFDFLNGIYYNFLCLTAIDFGQLVPVKLVLLSTVYVLGKERWNGFGFPVRLSADHVHVRVCRAGDYDDRDQRRLGLREEVASLRQTH